MFIVKPDGSILCETVQDALAMQREMLTKKAPKSEPEERQEQHDQPPRPLILRRKTNGHAPELDFLRKLSDHIGEEIGASELAPLLGAKDAAGAGPKLYHVTQKLERSGYQLKDYMKSRKRAGGKVRWTVIKGLD